MTAGIYAIRHLASGKEYVGQAANIDHRWYYHRWQLRHHRHGNTHLQRAWDKYGEGAFAFRVLEVVADLTKLDAREHYFGDLLRPAYNLKHLGKARRGLRGMLVSDATIARVAVALMTMVTDGVVPLPIDIARRTGLGSATVKKALRYVPLWTKERSREAHLAGAHRASQQLAALGYPNVRKLVERGKVTRAKVVAAFHDAVARGETVSAAKIGACIGESKQTVLYWLWQMPEWSATLRHAARVENGRVYAHQLRQTPEQIQLSLSKARAALEATNYLPHKLAGERRRGQPLPPTHKHVQAGQAMRQSILGILSEWVRSGDGSLYGASRIAPHLGISTQAVKVHLRKMRASRLLDQYNRPTAAGEGELPPPPMPQMTERLRLQERILDALRDYARHDDDLSPLGAPRLERLMGVNKGTIGAHLRALRAAGVIDAHNRPL